MVETKMLFFCTTKISWSCYVFSIVKTERHMVVIDSIKIQFNILHMKKFSLFIFFLLFLFPRWLGLFRLGLGFSCDAYYVVNSILLFFVCVCVPISREFRVMLGQALACSWVLMTATIQLYRWVFQSQVHFFPSSYKQSINLQYIQNKTCIMKK